MSQNEYSSQELYRAVLACVIFSTANDNQGLKEVAGKTFGDKVHTIIHHTLNSKSAVEVVSKLKTFTGE